MSAATRRGMVEGLKAKNADAVPVLAHPGANVPELAFGCRIQADDGTPSVHLTRQIRQGLTILPTDALFVLVKTPDGPVLIDPTKTMGTIYSLYADADDGFLHVVYDVENTFGG